MKQNQVFQCYSLILLQKIETEKSTNDPVFLKVVRNKVVHKEKKLAFLGATKLKNLDNKNTVYFNNEVSFPLSIVKKGDKFIKKVIEIQFLKMDSNKNQETEMEIAKWKFDAANLPTPNDPSIRKSVIENTQLGKVTIYIRFMVKNIEDFPLGKPPDNFFEFITKRTEKPEIQNLFDNGAQSDIDGEFQDEDISTFENKNQTPIKTYQIETNDENIKNPIKPKKTKIKERPTEFFEEVEKIYKEKAEVAKKEEEELEKQSKDNEAQFNDQIEEHKKVLQEKEIEQKRMEKEHEQEEEENKMKWEKEDEERREKLKQEEEQRRKEEEEIIKKQEEEVQNEIKKFEEKARKEIERRFKYRNFTDVEFVKEIDINEIEK